MLSSNQLSYTALKFGQPHLTSTWTTFFDYRKEDHLGHKTMLVFTALVQHVKFATFLSRCIHRQMHIDSQENTKHLNTSTMLQLNSDAYSRNTRFNKLNLCCPIYNNYWRGWTFSFRSIEDWNNMEKALINSKDKKFQSLKNTLLERQRK